MSATFDYVLRQCSVFCNGVGKAGTSEEFTLPKIEKKKDTKQSGGLIGERNVFFGYKPFVLKVKLNSFDPDVTRLAGVQTGAEVPFSARGYLVGDLGKKHTAVWTGSGEVGDVSYDAWVAGKWVFMTFEVSLSAMALSMDGKEVYNIDIPNMIDSWGGTDQAAAARTAIGF